MANRLLNSKDAATALGVSVLTLYDWLSQSDAGRFEIRGQPVTVSYLQGGRCGRGRIKIASEEIKRLLELMRVTPKAARKRLAPKSKISLQHITTKLGRPDDL